MKTKHQFKVGDRVAFSREFLRNTGQFTGWAPFARGRIAVLNTLSAGVTIAAVQWDGAPSHGQVLTANLWPEDKLHLESA